MASNREREPARDKCAVHLVQALAEGWGCERLAKEAGVSTNTARDVLAGMSQKLTAMVDNKLGVHIEAMRSVAAIERPAVVSRLKSAGELCDSILAKAHEILAEITCDTPFDTSEEGGAPPIMPEDRLAKLATICQKVSAAAGQSWAAYKDASGLALAERVKETALSAKAKADVAQDSKDQSAIEVEVIFSE